MKLNHREERGIVLPLVLIIGLLLSASVVTFVHRSVVDKLVVVNRDRGEAAAALARGGVQIAIAVLFEDRLQKIIQQQSGEPSGSSLEDLWARLANQPLKTDWGGQLVVRIEDSGARLNLNALVPVSLDETPTQPSEEAEEFLIAFFERILDPGAFPSDATRDPRELARNLLDYIDADDVALGGRSEDDYYLNQAAPYTAANRPLLSVDEVAMIEGFDTEMAERLRPYFTVYPLLGETGVNANTAQPHVLGLIYYGSSGNMRLADESLVGDLLRERDAGKLICTETERAPDLCVSMSEVGIGEGAIFPPVVWPAAATIFTIVSEARVRDVAYTIEAVIDLSNGREPRLLSWRTI